MNTFLPLFFGIVIAAIGIFPPGLINMTAAKVSLKDGKLRALMFVFGALVVIFFQTIIALIFARYIDGHREISLLLREIGFIIFSVLTIYFFWIAKKPTNNIQNDIKIKSKKSRFFLGMFISAINFFPIPYYVFMSVTLASFSYFNFDETSIYTFATGVVLGSFLVFYGYITYFKNLDSKTTFISKNMNSIIGSITGLVALMSLIYIVKNNFNI